MVHMHQASAEECGIQMFEGKNIHSFLLCGKKKKINETICYAPQLFSPGYNWYSTITDEHKHVDNGGKIESLHNTFKSRVEFPYSLSHIWLTVPKTVFSPIIKNICMFWCLCENASAAQLLI